MSQLPKPAKLLRILTIDGGGLQAITTLQILDKLLSAVAENNGITDSKPRPCDIFDVIGGIGSGGWLALLLGRFQMDVPAALAEWHNLVECITPRSTAEGISMRLVHHKYFDTERLLEQIDGLTQFYETDTHMFCVPPEGVRCKQTFVAAPKIDSADKPLGYDLLRTYECPAGHGLLNGPPDPREYKISHAFAATGAIKYFTHPWKETSIAGGTLKYMDSRFPSPHRITELALNEVLGLYGNDVRISVVVSIGPGVPCVSDCRDIARRFSWGSKSSTTDTRHSEQHLTIKKKLRRNRDEIEEDIRRKIRDACQGNTPPYYRLAPDVSAPGTVQNDTSSPKAAVEAAMTYLQIPQTKIEMQEISQHINASSAAAK